MVFCSSIIIGCCFAAAVAWWSCFAVVRPNNLCPSSHSSELLYAADIGNDYNYHLEERKDVAVSRVVCLIVCVTKMFNVLLCPQDI